MAGREPEATDRLRILRYSPEKAGSKDDLLVEEITVTITLNGREMARLQALPTHLAELGVGFLVSEGYLARNGVRSVRVEGANIYVEGDLLGERRILAVGSACGASETSLDEPQTSVRGVLVVEPATVLSVMKKLFEGSRIHNITGATHAALFADVNGNILFLAEDLGRHNAVDKVVGWSVLNNIDPCKGILAVSGRLTLEMVLKAVRAGFCIVVSKSATTLQAALLARKYGLTLIGFARGNSFNIYSGKERIAV